MNLNNEDVINISKVNPPSVGKTFKVDEFLQWLYVNLDHNNQELVKGIDAKVLSATQPGGWKKGIVQIKLEFTEQSPESNQ